MEHHVHNHGPDKGPGLDCGEREIDGKLYGNCLITTLEDLPAGTIIAKGAFNKSYLKNVPLTFEGREIGRAEISEDGQTISMEITNDVVVGRQLREAFLYNIADGLSLGVDYRPAVPCVPVAERKKARWFGKTTPWGM